jgi:hypothetical protein
LVDKWVNQSVTETASAPVSLAANQKYDILMEYYENTSRAEAHLNWSSASQVKQAVATTQLYPASLIGPVVPAMTARLDGANQVFNWSGTFTLQTAVSINGPFTNLTGWAAGPYTNSLVSDPQRYFRLKAN